MSVEFKDRRGDRWVGWWLLSCCALVFAMVVLGGVTRLTGSGLSMVDWRPVTGILPPMSADDWAASFDAYRQSPEFQRVNPDMTVESYRGIFWLEYLHRLLGRLIGLAFAIPFVVFWIKGFIVARQAPVFIAMFVLGGLQGLLGWYMVKSGLVADPHVSQYRLTAHLLAAFSIYVLMLWIALNRLFRHTDGPRHPWFGRTIALTVLIAVTIVSGGFVAGLKAGFAFNTFPLMAGEWVPPGIGAFQPWWRNLFENIVTVQFDHRWLAMTTLAASLLFVARASGAGFPRRARPAIPLFGIVVTAQVALGLSTLLLGVPIWAAACHQATALVLLTVVVYLAHTLAGQSALESAAS